MTGKTTPTQVRCRRFSPPPSPPALPPHLSYFFVLFSCPRPFFLTPSPSPFFFYRGCTRRPVRVPPAEHTSRLQTWQSMAVPPPRFVRHGSLSLWAWGEGRGRGAFGLLQVSPSRLTRPLPVLLYLCATFCKPPTRPPSQQGRKE